MYIVEATACAGQTPVQNGQVPSTRKKRRVEYCQLSTVDQFFLDES